MHTQPPKSHEQVLRNLYPGNILEKPDKALQAILRTIVMRSNFIPAVRYRIGWRGLHACAGDVEAWTAKIADWSGVFGIIWVEWQAFSRQLSGRFQLTYFPDPEEALVERFSLQAAAWTQREDYLSCVRQFPRHAELCDLFYIGDLFLTLDLPDFSVGLNLKANSNLGTQAEDGVSVTLHGEKISLVEPGGWDQHLPAFAVAKTVYEVLGASTAFCLETAPSAFTHHRSPGHVICYRSDGRQTSRPVDDAWINECRLEFNADPPANAAEKRCRNNSAVVCWRQGQPTPSEWESAPWWQAHLISDYKSLDKQLLGIDDRPSMIVLSGFLGSGKTSFLENFVAYQIQRDRFVVVIQNEIGETGLDGKLLGSDNLVVTEIDEGCVCCTLSGQLKPALQHLCTEFHPDFIVLETTGLANPMNFMDDLVALNDLVRIDSVTTMVDALSYPSSRIAPEIVLDQIRSADIVLLNKVDGLSPQQVEEMIAHLRQKNPHAPIIPTIHGEVNPGLLYSPDPRDTQLSFITGKNTDTDYHCHLEDRIKSHKVVLKGPLNRHRFIQTIEGLIPSTVFRIKGIALFSDLPGPMLVQYVAGRYEISNFPDRWEDPGFLICIGQDIAPEPLDDLFHRCLSAMRTE